MDNLYAWARDWGISDAAIADYRRRVGVTDPVQQPGADSERGVAARVRLAFAAQGDVLWRNNVGALPNPDTGTPIRFGLANDSKRMNDKIKSSDLIGIHQVTIRPEHLGLVIGQFVSIETKAPGWQYNGTPREKAQLNWIQLINSLGGCAYFTT